MGELYARQPIRQAFVGLILSRSWDEVPKGGV